MRVLGWCYWAVYQLASLVVGAYGLIALLPLCAFKLWHSRPSELAAFGNRTVIAFHPAAAALAGGLAGAVIGAIAWHEYLAMWILLGGLIGGWGAWDNDEDGVIPPAVVGSAPFLPTSDVRYRAYVWSALRNFANGLRKLPGATYVITPALAFRDTGSGYVATDGWRQCLTTGRIRIGWNIHREAAPGDIAWPIAGRP